MNFLRKIDEFDNYNWDFDKILPKFVLDEDKDNIYITLKMMFFKELIFPGTGIVIAGFNQDDMFPSFMAFNLIANNNGKY